MHGNVITVSSCNGSHHSFIFINSFIDLYDLCIMWGWKELESCQILLKFGAADLKLDVNV